MPESQEVTHIPRFQNKSPLGYFWSIDRKAAEIGISTTVTRTLLYRIGANDHQDPKVGGNYRWAKRVFYVKAFKSSFLATADFVPLGSIRLQN